MLKRRTCPDGIAFLVPPRLEDSGFLVAFAERTGGVGRGPFASLNLGLKAGDDIENARTNRRRLCRALGLESFAIGRQVHGTRVARVGAKRAGSGFLDPGSAFPATDLLTTAASRVAIAVLTADCVPIVLADPVAGRLAVVHAGWRGVARGAVARGLALFVEPTRVMAAVGPAIGQDHYEVGAEVAAAVGWATEGGALVRGRGERVHLDLPGTVALILAELGVRSIERDASCTACEPARFFSYRRDGVTGRQGVVAMRRT